jgi:hypothetical protein
LLPTLFTALAVDTRRMRGVAHALDTPQRCAPSWRRSVLRSASSDS